jgi:Ca-activated chloride channel family protein
MILAISQPRWGRPASQSLPPGHDAVLVIDVSRSMAALDAVPSRLGAAIEAAESLVKALAIKPANRAAVVAFAGRGVLRCPLTENLGAVLDALDRLRPGAVRPGGTDLGAALDAALEAMEQEEHAQGQAIVVFTDGEDLADRWRTPLERLRQEGVVVHGVLVGDFAAGATVPSVIDGTPMLYHGQPVVSKRSDAALLAIARQTGGAVIPLGLAAADLGALYRTRIEPAARRRHEALHVAGQADRFPLFLMTALAMLLSGCWPPRRGSSWRGLWPWKGPRSWRRPARVLGPAAAVIGLAVAASGAGQSPAVLPSSNGSELLSNVSALEEQGQQPAPEWVARGLAAFGEGRLEEALVAFDAAAIQAERLPIPRYNAAAVLFQLGRYGEARRRYLEARELADRSLRTKIDYALGNTVLAQGAIHEAIGFYDRCIASTAPGAALDAVRSDARINRAFAYEQEARSLEVPQDEGSEGPPRSRHPDRQRGPDDAPGQAEESSAGQPESGPSAGGGGSEGDTQKEGGRERSPRSGRRFGGAGGSRPGPAGAAGEAPEDRLDAALEHIRAAQARRLPEEEPPASADNDRRDW